MESVYLKVARTVRNTSKTDGIEKKRTNKLGQGMTNLKSGGGVGEWNPIANYEATGILHS